jgi:drug/metabolite transporter (DMT)-like permease
MLVLARGLHVPVRLEAWGALLGLALVSTVLPILTFYAGMQRLGAAQAAILSTAEPILTLILAALLLDERLSATQILGGGLILGSVLLLQLRGSPDAAQPAG